MPQRIRGASHVHKRVIRMVSMFRHCSLKILPHTPHMGVGHRHILNRVDAILPEIRLLPALLGDLHLLIHPHVQVVGKRFLHLHIVHVSAKFELVVVEICSDLVIVGSIGLGVHQVIVGVDRVNRPIHGREPHVHLVWV